MTVTASIQKPRKRATTKSMQGRQAKRKIAPTMLQWRFLVVLFAVFSVFIALASRAAFIQVIQNDVLIEKGDNRTIRIRQNATFRGLISDRNGQQLAVSVPAQAVSADPKVIKDKNSLQDIRKWRALAEVLDTDVDKLLDRVDGSGRFVYLQRQVTPAMATFVRNLALPGVFLLDESKRYYPMGEVSSHIIGITDADDKGREGVESLYNKWLTGTPGERKIIRDGKNRQVEILEQSLGTPGNDITLTIDQRIQAIAFRQIKEATVMFQAASASVVIVDVHTGEVLAMANTPSYNPNNRSTMESYRVRNRAITDAFEPGSVLKPLAIIAALENGYYQTDSIVDTSPGWRRLGGSRIEDARNYGKLSITEIIQHSSNIGTSELALSMPKEVLIDFYYNMGMMSDSGTNMIGESSGIFHERPRWSDHEISSLSFGYNIAVTTTQLARMYATIANGGMKRPLSVVKNMNAPIEPERVISEQVAHDVLLMLETVTEKDGTAYKARVPGYRVAGKTGTSKKAFAGSYGEEYVNIFAGIAPVSNPQIAVVVLINEPGGDFYHAGDTAATVFSSIVSDTMQMMNIPPDAMNIDAVLERQLHAAK
ncbi:MAG: cell division protein FtsI (penicillin-binding protein 3) [Kangiellaceae bacterium]|jgi:cell division protein FtsI (penicillin-binding protein 3)